MKTKEEHLLTFLKIAFGIMLLSVVLLLIFGEIFLPKEDPTGSGKSDLFEAQWERVFPDGTREEIELPDRCEAQRKEIVRLETTLPQNQDNTWLCMRASQQDMRVYVGGELRQEYTTRESRIFGRNSVSAYVFFEITAQDAGKVLAIELVSDSEYAGFLNEVYEGDKYDIAYGFIEKCFLVILVSLCMLILSSVTVLVGCVLRFIYKIRVDITYLGLGILVLSLTMITESKIRQFFLPNASIAAYVGFWLTMLLPYPFMVYVSRIQKGRYVKIYKALSLCVAANFFVSTVLELTNIWHIEDSSVISYAMILFMVIIMAATICLDIIKGRIREYGEIIFGLIAMILVSIWEIYINLVPETPYYGGVAQSFGLIILLFMAVFKTAREMLEIEKEKQMAIVAGEAKAKFIANMSHEIRTPINTIIGMNEMILRENHDDAVEEYARNVQNASNLLLGLINDILDFSKMEAGKLSILENEYHLSKMLFDVIKGIEIKAAAKDLSFSVKVEEDLPSVLKGDEIRIRQILNNLLSNAVKYTKQGTVSFKVNKILDCDKFMLCMSVEDTGMGIKPEDVDRLFDSFQRLEEHKNRHIEGTGLGLNITRQLVELMGGTIEVKSEYGKGSCFTVKIPQEIIDETSIGNLEEAYRRDTEKKVTYHSKLYAPEAQILAVDDNEMNLAVIKALLRRTEIKLTLAHDGRECLELCKTNKYDLILMDHMMPDPDGIATLHMLRRDRSSQNQHTDVIVLTANAIAGAAEKYKEEGFSDYLSKPIVVEELEEMLSTHLPRKKLLVKAENPGDEKDALEKIAGNSIENQEESGAFFIDKNMGMSYCCNDEAMYQEMVDAYYQQGQKNLPQLSQYFESRDWKKYKVIVHALKSTSLVIGAAEFSEKAKRLETAAKEGNEEILLAENEAFLEEYKAILELINKK